MAWQPNIPRPTDEISQSQADLLGNFQAINTLVNVNHEDFGDPNEGKHKFVQMPEQGAGPGTGANIGAIYTKDVAGVTQLFYQDSNAKESQLTDNASETTSGYIYLTKTLLMQWDAAPKNNGDTFTYPLAFTTLYSVQLTVYNNQANVYVEANNPGLTNFSVSTNGNGKTFAYIAIGQKV